MEERHVLVMFICMSYLGIISRCNDRQFMHLIFMTYIFITLCSKRNEGHLEMYFLLEISNVFSS